MIRRARKRSGAFRRPHLGVFAPAVDPTAGERGGGPISVKANPCPSGQVRYLADGTAQASSVMVANPSGKGAQCSLPGTWANIDMSKPFDGLKMWVDDIEMVWSNEVVNPNLTSRGAQIGWNMTPAGETAYDAAITAMTSQPIIYAPLPPGVDGTVKVITPYNISDPVMMQYSIALAAATAKGMDKSYRYYDPMDWSGYTVLPDGFLDPADGGEATFADGDVLDYIQQQKGVAGNEWYWILYTNPTTGEIKAYLTQHIWQGGDIFSKMTGTDLLAIQVLGAILGAVTFGAAAAAAAVITAAAKVDQTEVAASDAKQQASHDAAVQQSQTAFQTSQTTAQVDQFYQQNQATFLAAGYDQAAWDNLTLQQKTDLIQQAADGQLQPTPAAVAAAAQVQTDINTAAQGAIATAGTGASVTAAPSGSGGLLLGAGVLGLVLFFASKGFR
jgi:hypothetical protein